MVAHHTHTHTHIRTYADIFAAKCWLSVRDRSDRAEATFLVPSALGHLTDPVPSLQEKVTNLYLLAPPNAQWSDLFVRHYSQSSSDVSTNLRAALFSHICLVTLKILHMSSKDHPWGWSKFVVGDFIRFNMRLDTRAGNHFDTMQCNNLFKQ